MDKLEQKWHKVDRELDEAAENIQEEDAEFEQGEGTTELSRLLAQRVAERDRSIGTCDEERDRALFDRNNPREDKSLLLDSIVENTRKDIQTLEAALEEGAEYAYEEVPAILDELKKIETKATQLRTKFHEADLPPIRSRDDVNETSPSQNSSNHFTQDSSDVHQTDYNSFDPFGEE